MNCQVAVYHFRSPADAESPDGEPAPFVVLSVELDLVATVEIKADGLTAKEVAARAWIEAVGRERQSKLIKMKAPPAIIEGQVDPLRQSDDIREAPEPLSQLGGAYQFILDNGCECWLIQLGGDWSPDCRFSALVAAKAARQATGCPVAAAFGDCHAALRSLWTPRLN